MKKQILLAMGLVFISSAAFASIPESIDTAKIKFQREVNDEIAALDEKIEYLSIEIEESQASLREASQAELKELQARRDNLDKKYNEFVRSSGLAWKDLRGGVKKALVDLKTAYNKASSQFN